MSLYRGAFYQIDFLNELAKQVPCVFYGPNYPGFSNGDHARRLRDLISTGVDAVVLAHSFLSDNPKKALSWMEPEELARIKSPKYALLNKEYSRLREKISFFHDAGVEKLYSHHHDLPSLHPSLSLDAEFLPFAFNSDRFFESEEDKPFDLGFSGLLRNLNFPESQGLTRLEVQREIFHTLNDFPLRKKDPYKSLSVRWHTWTGKRVHDSILSLFPSRRKLSEGEYASALRETKVWLNAHSPLGLISTRYFECMASGAVVLAEESSALRRVFPSDTLRTFSSVDGFRHNLRILLNEASEREHIAKVASTFVSENHTWRHRVRQFISGMNA